jgi:hypothetical protein
LLDSETKGTGAHVAPLQSVLEKPRAERPLELVTFKRSQPPAKAAEAPAALKFKVIDVMSAQTLAEGVDTRETIALLEAMRSVLDVRLFVWLGEPRRWRLLSLEEHRALWRFRGDTASEAQ